jgi:hypothetical protein
LYRVASEQLPALSGARIAAQRWIERQVEKLVQGNYFLITFTVSAELRPLP